MKTIFSKKLNINKRLIEINNLIKQNQNRPIQNQLNPNSILKKEIKYSDRGSPRSAKVTYVSGEIKYFKCEMGDWSEIKNSSWFKRLFK